MSVITRDDKVQFVVQPYRELLSYRTASLLKREVRYLAQQNGQYVRLFQQLDGRYEAVFSREPGYLLAEAIWHHFKKPTDLIYCEELPDSKHALVVIIRSSSILFDAKLPIDTLGEELATLLTLKNKFTIYIYGNIPLTQKQEEDKVVFDSDHVLSFTRLEGPAFPELQPKAGLQLVPIEQAIKEERLGKVTLSGMLSIVIVALLFTYLGLHYMQQNQVHDKGQTDPYLPFRSALSTPAPRQQLQNFSHDVAVMYALPGWIATNVNYSGSIATFQVHSLGGNIADLYAWAKQHAAEVQLTTTGAKVSLAARIDSRPKPKTISSTQHVVARIIDNMLRIMPGQTVNIENITNHGIYRVANINISYHDVTPDVLRLIGDNLAGLPIKLDNASASIDNGLLSGTIKLTVLGN